MMNGIAEDSAVIAGDDEMTRDTRRGSPTGFGRGIPRWRRALAAVASIMAALSMTAALAPASYAAGTADVPGSSSGGAMSRSDDAVIRSRADAGDDVGVADEGDGGDPDGALPDPDKEGSGTTGPGKEPEQPDPDKPDPEQPDPDKPNPDKPDPEPTEPTQSEPKVTSSFTRHEPVGVDSVIADVVDVSGFPDDHGKVDGDNARIQVSLWWWSGGPQFGGLTPDKLFDNLNRPTGELPPNADKNNELIDTWEYEAVNGHIVVGNGAKDADGKVVRIKAEKAGWYVFMWKFEGDARAKAFATRFDDLAHAHPVTKAADKQNEQPDPGPAPAPNPDPAPDGKGEDDGTGGGDGGDPTGTKPVNEPTDDQKKQAQDLLNNLNATNKKYTNGNNPLAKTGVNIGTVVLVVVSALAVGAFMLAVIRRHKS